MFGPNCTAPRHGTLWAYSHDGCRCPDAREEWRIYSKRRREKRNHPRCIDATGSIRRLRALVVNGWGWKELGHHSGESPHTVRAIALGKHNAVRVATAAWVRDLFALLCDTPGASEQARETARRRGWHPAGAWDDIDNPDEQPNVGNEHDDTVDEVLVRRAIHNPRLAAGMNDAEKVELARVWRQHRLNRGEPYGYKPLAAQFGIKESQAQHLIRAVTKAAHEPTAAGSRINRKAA
ncbi:MULTISPECIES: hypothetical protein [unclassified Micromonospora]|uniref:hypothetical protein n=1 Tax=unclassified Micromonospora TaxID=2617518 RepID=UPI003317EC70